MANTPSIQTKQRLVEGNLLRCPLCNALGDPFRDFKPLQFVEHYHKELNRVMMHRRDRGGCGHIFSPGDPWIIEAYLAGDLIPLELLKRAQQRIKELEKQLQMQTEAVA